jgi:uncharacterized glyoxalase superfamily protein PhnB
MPWLSPYLVVQDAAAALDFYQRAFGFEKKFAMQGPDGRQLHTEVQYHEAVIMFGPENDTGACDIRAPATSGVKSPVSLYVYCTDVDALFARATAAGARAVQPPHDEFWGDRICQLHDPDGHTWTFATCRGEAK